MVAENFVTRSCGIPHLVQQASVTGFLIGEINNTFTYTAIATYCLCNTDECNKGNHIKSSNNRCPYIDLFSYSIIRRLRLNNKLRFKR